MPLRRFRSIRSSQRRNASDMRPFNKRLDAKSWWRIPLARDEAKSLSRLTRLLQSLYPVNTGARRTCLPCREDVHHARAERHAGAARDQRRRDRSTIRDHRHAAAVAITAGADGVASSLRALLVADLPKREPRNAFLHH